MSMFCYQCEQTAKGTGCDVSGVCGKKPAVAALQDTLVRCAKVLGRFVTELRGMGVSDREADRFIVKALFTTVTNVNFDPGRLEAQLRQAQEIGIRLDAAYKEACQQAGKTAEVLCCEDGQLAETLDGIVEQAAPLQIDKRREAIGEDVMGLQELILYGLKGTAAYADHAMVLGVEDDEVYGFFAETLAYLATNPTDVGELTACALKVGEVNLKVMGMLDQANTDSYGHPEPTSVRITPVAGKAILVSGHDLKDLDELLQQTEGKGINVYTHGEMLPCNAYPGLKKYSHLVGNYGGAWQDQKREFDAFPGSILMTTNCIQKPADSYKARIFTSGLVAWPGVTHIADGDFTPVIDAALAAPGFAADAEEKSITVGFARNAVMSVAGTVIEAVKAGQIKHFFLVGGCDGAKSGRNYYTDFAQQVPQDCVILTLGLWKVPLQQARLRRHRRHPPSLGRGPMQRRLFGRPNRRRPGRGVRVRSQRPAALDDHLLVRAKGRLHPPHALAPGHPRHPSGPQPAGVCDPRGTQRPDRKLQHQSNLDTGRGPGRNPGLISVSV